MDIDDDRPNPDAQDGTCRPRLQLSEHFTEEPAVEPYVPPSPDRSATTEHGMGRWLRRWPCKNARREKIWREVCQPGCGPGYGLLFLGLSLLAGFFIWIVLTAIGPKPGCADASQSPPAMPRALPCPRSAAVLLGRVAPPGVADETEPISEAEEDDHASMAAGAWQLDTNYKLSQIDMLWKTQGSTVFTSSLNPPAASATARMPVSPSIRLAGAS